MCTKKKSKDDMVGRDKCFYFIQVIHALQLIYFDFYNDDEV